MSIVNWHWSFGDGKYSNEQNPKHTYIHPSTYTVTLTITDDSDDTYSETKTSYITVSGDVPIATTIQKLYCYSYTPDGDGIGGSEMHFAQINSMDLFQPTSIVLLSENKVFVTSDYSGVYRVMRLFENGNYQDIYAGNGYQYSITAKSAPLQLSADGRMWGELRKVTLHVDLKDADGMGITATSDLDRFIATGTYTESVGTQLATGAYNYIRKMIDIHISEGITGRMFDIKMEKVVPTDGDFRYGGAVLDVTPKPQLDAEFNFTLTTRAGAWE
jgi:PKD repeat protein